MVLRNKHNTDRRITLPEQNPVRGCASKVYMVQKQHGSPPLHDSEQLFFFRFSFFVYSTVSADLLREVMHAELK